MKHKKEEIYLDLSKCSEEEQKKAISITYAKCDMIEMPWFILLNYSKIQEKWIVSGCKNDDALKKKEINIQQFCELFPTSAESEEVELFEENQRRAGIRHAIYLLESFKEDYYSVDAKSLYNSIDVLCDFVRSKGADIEPLNWINSNQ